MELRLGRVETAIEHGSQMAVQPQCTDTMSAAFTLHAMQRLTCSAAVSVGAFAVGAAGAGDIGD